MLHQHSSRVAPQWQNSLGAPAERSGPLLTHTAPAKALARLEFSNSCTVLTPWRDKNKESAWHAVSQGENLSPA